MMQKSNHLFSVSIPNFGNAAGCIQEKKLDLLGIWLLQKKQIRKKLK
jgi:hypothetical protein